MGRIAFIIGQLLISSVLIASNFNNFRVPLYFNLKSGIAYDSNYLKLSDKEIEEIYLYPEILGDAKKSFSLISKTSLIVIYKPFFLEGHETKVKLKFGFNNYLESKNKSFYSYGLSIGQQLDSYKWIKFVYSFMPNYYLRDYRDKDDIILNENTNNILVNCKFNQESISLSYSNPLAFFKRSWLEGRINYKTQFYGPSFTEFDLVILSYGISIYTKVIKNYNFSTKYFISNADNITYLNGLISTNRINRGYEQKIISFSFMRNSIKNILFQKLGLNLSYAFRNYTSKDIVDVLHRNRSHTDIKIGAWISGKLNESLEYRLNIINRDRITIANNIWVEDLKNFSKYECQFLLSYNFTSNILY